MGTETRTPPISRGKRELRGDWLSPSEVALRLDVPYATLIKWIHDGAPAAYKFSGASNGPFRIRPSDLDAFVERAQSEHVQRNGDES